MNEKIITRTLRCEDIPTTIAEGEVVGMLEVLSSLGAIFAVTKDSQKFVDRLAKELQLGGCFKWDEKKIDFVFVPTLEMF